MTIQELDRKLKRTAKNYLNLERELLGLILAMDKRKGFYRLGYKSLFSYVTEALSLSPAVAYSFINVARKSHEVPELKKQVESGRLSISKAQKMTSVLTVENKNHWFAIAQKATHRQLEREVALASPKQAVRESMSYVAANSERGEKVIFKREAPRIALQVGISEKLMLQIRRAQDLESQRQKRNVDLEETLSALVDHFLERKDPIKIAKRQKVRGKIEDPEILEDPQELTAMAVLNQKDDCEKFINNSWEEFNALVPIKSTAADPEEPIVADPIKQIAAGPGKEAPSARVEAKPSASAEPSVSTPSKRGIPNTFKSKVAVPSKSMVSLPVKFAGTHRREAIPAAIRHQIHLRDHGRCTYRNATGQRCQSQRFLEVHHIRPVAEGGANLLSNLTLLCSGHHKVCHQKSG